MIAGLADLETTAGPIRCWKDACWPRAQPFHQLEFSLPLSMARAARSTTVGLVFVKVEADAQKGRADLVEKLKSRFGEVKTFGSHLEMAPVAKTDVAERRDSTSFRSRGAKSKTPTN
jgi:hypothetical protein